MNLSTRHRKKSLTFLLLLFILGNATAQKDGVFKNTANLYTSAGIGGGSAHYVGDLTPLSKIYFVPYTNVRWNGTAHYTKYLNENFGAKVSFTWVRLYGDDYTFSRRDFTNLYQNYVRNLHFRNDVQEFAISGIWNVIKRYGNNNQIRPKFTPYVSAGVGFVAHNPKAIQRVTTSPFTVSDKWVPLKQYTTAGQGLGTKKPYSLVVPVIPLAAGFRMRINQNIDLGFEAGYRMTFTDYLDDVGNDAYPAGLDATAAGFSYRANEDFHAVSGESRLEDFGKAFNLSGGTVVSGLAPSGNATAIYSPTNPSIRRGSGSTIFHKFDQYLMTQVTLNFVISNQVKCPPIR